ncbi:Hypothetical protein CINCED_3A012871 [Cinara cedri]|uniref:Reverse transcriptase domain n=1 Tax=Cinara cedri TaxID=506608 RepID=A0A5E4MN99_9HEMI|nr:Hypothetical protein CINCED_3A012871 [Cinara cedri]
MFASYFKFVYSCEVINGDVSNLAILFFDLPNNVYFTVDDVFQDLSTLLGIKTICSDGLSGVYIYQLRSIIAYSLFLLFQPSLDEGNFPSVLKFSSIMYIHKSSNKSNITHYRLIPVQFNLSQLFESLILNSIKPSVNNILIEEQAKSFRTVNHKLLLKVLQASGFGDPLLSWFGSFLNQKATVDDKKLFTEINSADDCTNLQNSLDCFVHWCSKIGFKVNSSKCRIM